MMRQAVRWAVALAAVAFPVRFVASQIVDTASSTAEANRVGAIRRAVSGFVVPGDKIFVKVWREPQLSDTAFVDENGAILLPKVGAIPVTSIPIAAIPDSVRARYGQYLRDLPMDVIVLRRVVVNGAVTRPGVYYADVTSSLRDLIARAGGVTQIGNAGNVMIVRGAKAFRVANWQEDDSPASDLHSGDQVVVGEKSWFEQNALSVISVSTVVVSLLLSLRGRL